MENLKEFLKDFKSIDSIVCVSRDSNHYNCKLLRKNNVVDEISDISTITIEKFPEEDIPKVEYANIGVSREMMFITGFGEIRGPAHSLILRFEKPARVRKELSSLFIFKE